MTSAHAGSFASGAASMGTMPAHALNPKLSDNSATDANTCGWTPRDTLRTHSGYRVCMVESSDPSSLTVGDVGEAGVLQTILGALGADVSPPWLLVGPGDDCAVVRPNGDLVITTDAMVQGPDFRLAWTTPRELGWKLAATNLSDVASMGAWPLGLTVTVMAPPSTALCYLAEVAHGLADACARMAPGTAVIGGDLSHADTLAFSVTAVGEMRGVQPVTRSGARPGDVVAYAGELGLAGAGLQLLSAACVGSDAEQARIAEQLRVEHPREMRAHLMPQPPVLLGPVAAQAGATAMMDVSDSLSLDGARLGAASGVTLNLLSSKLGENPGMSLTGGEDHGLLATFPSVSALPPDFRVIGEVVARSEDLLVDGLPFEPRGWDPFQC